MVKIKRAYEPAAKTDGYRILVDRLWPRGVSKARLKLNDWAKDIAPSDKLRKSFGHDPSRWKDFEKRYRGELRDADRRPLLRDLAARSRRGTVTLVYSTKDEEHNNAVVLAKLIKKAA